MTGKESGYTAAAWAVLAAALSQAVYHLAIKPLLRRYTGLEVAAYTIWAGTALLIPLAPNAARAVLDVPAGATSAAVYLGLLPSAAGFVVWGYAVARLSGTTATASLYLVPAAYLWLGEQPEPAALLGGLITIAGLALLNRPPDLSSSSPYHHRCRPPIRAGTSEHRYGAMGKYLDHQHALSTSTCTPMSTRGLPRHRGSPAHQGPGGGAWPRP